MSPLELVSSTYGNTRVRPKRSLVIGGPRYSGLPEAPRLSAIAAAFIASLQLAIPRSAGAYADAA